MSYYFTPTRVAIIKKPENNKCWQRCGEIGILIHCLWKCKMVWPLWKTIWQFLKKKLSIDLLYDPAIPLLVTYRGEMKSYVHSKINLHSNIFHNNQNVETIQMSINQTKDRKKHALYLYNGILCSNKKEQGTRTCYTMEKPQKYYAKLRKPKTKEHIL